MRLDGVVQRGTRTARVANTRRPSTYRRGCVERAFAAERKRYHPRASQRVFTTRRCQSAALLGVHSQPHRWLKLVISVYYSNTTSLIEREYDDTCDSLFVFLLVYRCLLPFKILRVVTCTRATTTPSQRRRRENNHTKTMLSSRIVFIIVIVIGCSARTISLSHHRFPFCSSFSPVPLSLKTTTKTQNDCCSFC